ncbi:MAG: 5-nucleotide phosphatase [Alphaproteobacteria bacterium]|nr:5-nucleotide phosphatase [Alphaproteobacteria bacterium]
MEVREMIATLKRAAGAVAMATLLGLTVSACTQSTQSMVPAHDNLNATLWMQQSVEFQGTARAAYALAALRLEQALADRTWTAVPEEQGSDYAARPPAIIVDLDETVLDNSRYQAWLTLNGQTFSQESWARFCHARISTPVAGSVEFLRQAEGRGVKVFYISNRTADLEESTRANMARFGYPLGGNVDTFLMARERPDWGSAKSTRRAHVARDYRVLLNIGDNFGDFTDAYRGSAADRQKVMDANAARIGRQWIFLANPSYGSWESAPFGHDFKKQADEQRAAKRAALDAWDGK